MQKKQWSPEQKSQEKRQQEKNIENLYAQVGRLTTQLDWLKKKSGGILPRD